MMIDEDAMTVFVLMREYAYEGESLLGVYATMDAAVAAAETYREGYSGTIDGLYIYASELGAPADVKFYPDRSVRGFSMPARKTVDIQPILDYANGFLSAKGGTRESRYGVICMLEAILFKANRYRGFCYLEQDQLSSQDLPGIRWTDPYGASSSAVFDNTDSTRRRYA